MTIPDYQTLMRPVLEVGANGETSVRDCIATLADKLGLTEDERRELLPSGKQTVFANRVHWAKTYLVQAGLLEITRRAHFKLTPRGSDVLAKHRGKIDNEVLMQFAQFREFRARSRSRPSNGFEPLLEAVPIRELAPASTLTTASKLPIPKSPMSCERRFSMAS
jgi:restriction system protein